MNLTTDIIILSMISIMFVSISIYLSRELASIRRFASGIVNDREMGEIVRYLYDLHDHLETKSIKHVQVSYVTPPKFTVFFDDDSCIEYAMIKLGHKKYDYIELRNYRLKF